MGDALWNSDGGDACADHKRALAHLRNTGRDCYFAFVEAGTTNEAGLGIIAEDKRFIYISVHIESTPRRTSSRSAIDYIRYGTERILADGFDCIRYDNRGEPVTIGEGYFFYGSDGGGDSVFIAEDAGWEADERCLVSPKRS